MPDPGTSKRLAILALALGLVSAACTSGPSQPRSSHSRPSTTSPVAHHVLRKLHRQTALKFVHLQSASNPRAVVLFESVRNLQPGQQGNVLAVRRVGNLIGSCNTGHPAVKFRLAYRGAGPPTVTEVRQS